MALQKQAVNINFSQGLDTKTDEFQVSGGHFLSLVNSIFTKTGLLQKRNGFGLITTATGSSTVTTFSESLVTLGNESLNVYSLETGLSANTGFLQPLSIATQPMVRSATSQTTCDIAIAANGLSCSTWLDSNANSYYQISDSANGTIIVPSVQLPSTATMPRCFVLGRYFIVTFLATVSAATHLQYVAIPIINPFSPLAATDIAITPSSLSAAYDGCVANNNLYLAWNESAVIGAAYITSGLIASTPISIASNTANLLSVTVDTTGSNAIIWITWYNSGSSSIKAAAYNNVLSSSAVLAPTTVVSSVTANEVVTSASNNVLNVFYEVANTYSYTPNAKSDYLAKNTLTLAGTAGTPATILRSVGLGSKCISFGGKIYMLATYGGSYQPTYFLIDNLGNIISKLAYSNGGGYAINQILPSMNVSGNTLQVAYLFKDLLAAANSQGNQNAAGVVPSPAGVYSQTGINLANFTFNSLVYSAETGSSLHVGAGFLWQFDGAKPVEHNFHVWPEDVTAVWSATGGSIVAQPNGSINTDAYYYQVCYEWTDAQGLIHRSAPSIPFADNYYRFCFYRKHHSKYSLCSLDL